MTHNILVFLFIKKVAFEGNRNYGENIDPNSMWSRGNAGTGSAAKWIMIILGSAFLLLILCCFFPQLQKASIYTDCTNDADSEVVDGAPFARRALPRNVMPSPYAPSQRSQLVVGGATANVNRLQPPSSKAVAATVDEDIPPPDYSHFVNNGVRRANSETNAV